MEMTEALQIAFPVTPDAPYWCPCGWIMEEVCKRKGEFDGEEYWCGFRALSQIVQLSLLTEMPLRELVKRVNYYLFYQWRGSDGRRTNGRLVIVQGYPVWSNANDVGPICVSGRVAFEAIFTTPVP